MQVNRSPVSPGEHAQDQSPPQSVPFQARPAARFLSVGAVARVLDMSEATMYRAIRAGEFPAVKVRNRYVVPARVLDAMESAALATGGMVDAADWVVQPGVA